MHLGVVIIREERPTEGVDRPQTAPYHEEMRSSTSFLAASAVLSVGLAAGLAGCDDAARKPAQARVPALQPAATPVATSTAQVNQHPVDSNSIGPLPLWTPNRKPLRSLLPPVPDGKAWLIARVEEKFAAGEQEYKAGHLETARRDFDEAVDWILESGYDPNSDPKLGELFHRVVDTVYGYELQAFRAGDGFREAPAVPAAIDEVADMTFPVDPNLKARAEEAAKNISHDLPLTVNDEVLSFLNFFQTPR